jgi:hypothetical protein
LTIKLAKVLSLRDSEFNSQICSVVSRSLGTLVVERWVIGAALARSS